MLKAYSSFVSSRAEHPALVSLFALAALLAGAGVLAAELWQAEIADVVGGHLMTYAVLASVMSAFGYLLLFGAKITRRGLRQLSELDYR